MDDKQRFKAINRARSGILFRTRRGHQCIIASFSPRYSGGGTCASHGKPFCNDPCDFIQAVEYGFNRRVVWLWNHWKKKRGKKAKRFRRR